jgi:hypothetical protein
MVVLNIYVRQSINEENSSLFMNSISYKLKNEGINLKSVKSEISQDFVQNPGVNEVNGTYGVQMKGILHFCSFGGLVVPVPKIFILPWLLLISPMQICFPHCFTQI